MNLQMTAGRDERGVEGKPRSSAVALVRLRRLGITGALMTAGAALGAGAGSGRRNPPAGLAEGATARRRGVGGTMGPVTTGPATGRRASEAPRGGGAAVHAAARAAYLRGDPVDMSALAKELGVGRATVYRWGGNREELLGAVLAEATERTFRAAMREADARLAGGVGAARVLAVLEAFMRAALAAEPLKAFTQREPALYVRLATSAGPVESRSAALVRELIEQEVSAGRMRTALPVAVLAHALVRVADGPLYAHLLGGGEPGLDEAVAVVAVLLGVEPAPSP